MPGVILDNVIAAGSVVGATGAALAGTAIRGAVPARTGAGVYTLTLPAGGTVDAAESVCVGSVLGATAGIVNFEHTSDLVKTVRVFDAAGAAADLDFNFIISQFRGGA